MSNLKIDIQIKFNLESDLKDAISKKIEGIDTILILNDNLPRLEYNSGNIQYPCYIGHDVIANQDLDQYEYEREEAQLAYLHKLTENANVEIENRRKMRLERKLLEEKLLKEEADKKIRNSLMHYTKENPAETLYDGDQISEEEESVPKKSRKKKKETQIESDEEVDFNE